MEQLLKVINLVIKEYRDKVNLILSEDTLTLEYLHIVNREKDAYKILELKEWENNKLKLKVYPERTAKIITIDELENILKKLEKEISQKEHTKAEIQSLVENFNIDFKGNIDEEDTPFLVNLFYNFVNQNLSEVSDREMFETLEILEEKINQVLDNDCKKSFNKFCDLQEKHLLDVAKQSFITGYCMCTQIQKETNFIGGNSNE